jgi:hypothetical protein
MNKFYKIILKKYLNDLLYYKEHFKITKKRMILIEKWTKILLDSSPKVIEIIVENH